MGMSGSFKIVPTQASYIFSTSGPQKTQKKGSFRISANYSNAKNFKRYPGYAIGKLTSRAILGGNKSNLMGEIKQNDEEMKQNVLGRCPIDKVHTTPPSLSP